MEMAQLSLLYGKFVELASLCAIRVIYELEQWQTCGKSVET